MSLQDVENLIGSYCFPIVACIVMFIMYYKMTQQHKEEADGFQQAIAANTMAIERLISYLEDK